MMFLHPSFANVYCSLKSRAQLSSSRDQDVLIFMPGQPACDHRCPLRALIGLIAMYICPMHWWLTKMASHSHLDQGWAGLLKLPM